MRRLLPFFCLLAALCVATVTRAADRPNILFVFSDDHAPHAIGAYDGLFKSVNPTPNIDKLAEQGMLFQNSFCTNSICGPSRAVIQTGKHSHLNGFMRNGNKFDGDQQTFPKLLRKAGYQTAMIGKWHLGTDPQGFDYWDVLVGQGEYYNPRLKSTKGVRGVEGYCTDVVTDLALDWLKSGRDADKPFMLMCQHKAPHRTWMPAARHLHLYDDVEIPEPETLFDDWKDNAFGAREQEMTVREHLNIVYDLFGPPINGWDPDAGVSVDKSGFRNLKTMTPEQLKTWNDAYGPKNAELEKAPLKGDALVRWKFQRYAKNYLRCVKGVDESLGTLTAYLDEAGLADDTIVIYSSDQGFYVGDHGWYDKRWMYEESLKMPLIVKWPGVTQAGTVDEHLVQNLDYAETFLEIAGAPVPDDMQGRSLVPLLKGEKVEWRDAIYYQYFEYPGYHMVPKHVGVRTADAKLMHFYEFDEWEFYDLAKDPEEEHNLYGKKGGHQKTIAALKGRLAELREQYADDTDLRPRPAEWQKKYRP